MGSEGFFPGAALGDFSKIFPEGTKSAKTSFPLETKRTTFLLKFSKSRGNPRLPVPLSDAYVSAVSFIN